MTMSALWGSPGSITADRLHGLPEQMQREGVLMLFDMGVTETAVRSRLGCSGDDLASLLRTNMPPWRRAEEPFGKFGGVE